MNFGKLLRSKSEETQFTAHGLSDLRLRDYYGYSPPNATTIFNFPPAIGKTQAGTVTIDVALDGPLPAGAVPDLSIDGTIQIEKLKDVLYTGRPASGAGTGTVGLFKLVEGGGAAVRVQVVLGRTSVTTVEIVRGLQVGDKIILSDMSQQDNVDRVRIK